MTWLLFIRVTLLTFEISIFNWNDTNADSKLKFQRDDRNNQLIIYGVWCGGEAL